MKAGPPLDILLAPKSVAVIGASEAPGNLGGRIIGYLDKFGYPGSVWPVHPKGGRVHGRDCITSLDALPERPEVALISVGAGRVVDAVRDCIAAGIRAGIAYAGGFAETGEEGAAMQAELTRICGEAGFAFCGPNTLGIINTWMPAMTSFGSHMIPAKSFRKGRVSIVSQSGGAAAVTHALIEQAGHGLRYMISAGNEAVLGVADYVDALAGDPETDVIAMYVEGTRDGPAFAAALARARAAGKRVIVLKAGMAEAGARAAAAHTGALAGAGRIWSAVLAEVGALRVESLPELVDAVCLAAELPGGGLPEGPVGVVGLGAPACAIAVRNLGEAGVVPGQAFVVPVTPSAAKLAEAVAGAAVGAAAVLVTAAGTPGDGAAAAEAMAAAKTQAAVPVLLSVPQGAPLARHLRAAGVHCFEDEAHAARMIAAFAHAPAPGPAEAPPEPLAFDWDAHVPGTGARVVGEHEAHRLLRAAGLPVAEGRLAQTAEDAADAAEAIAAPVAMKAVSPQITHRAAAGLVALGIEGGAAAAEVFRVQAARVAGQGADLAGIYVQKMEAGDLELIVSALRDPVFGTVVTCGVGGTATEVVDDVEIARAPLSVAAARALVGRMRIAGLAPVLEPGADPEALAELVSRFSRLAASAPFSGFAFEMNPVKWKADGPVAVDGLLITEAAE